MLHEHTRSPSLQFETLNLQQISPHHGSIPSEVLRSLMETQNDDDAARYCSV